MRFSELTLRLKTLKMSKRTLARLLGCSERAISTWSMPKRRVPGYAVAYLKVFEMLPRSTQLLFLMDEI